MRDHVTFCIKTIHRPQCCAALVRSVREDYGSDHPLIHTPACRPTTPTTFRRAIPLPIIFHVAIPANTAPKCRPIPSW